MFYPTYGLTYFNLFLHFTKLFSLCQGEIYFTVQLEQMSPQVSQCLIDHLADSHFWICRGCSFVFSRFGNAEETLESLMQAKEKDEDKSTRKTG